MRMNKKLKNVLAFGLATSFVLTSTMGVSATGDAVSYDDVTSYAATDTIPEVPAEDVTINVSVNFYDVGTGSMVVDATGSEKRWNTTYTVFCKTFLHKIAKTFCRSLQLHFLGNCKPGWQSWYLPAI